MDNFNLIYDKIKPSKMKKILLHRPIKISVNGDKEGCINSESLLKLMQKIKYLKSYRKLYCLEVSFDFKDNVFADKVVYMIFDSILYDLLKTTNYKIGVVIRLPLDELRHKGFINTALYRCNHTPQGHIDRDSFISAYECRIYTTDKSYRKMITRNVFEKSLEVASITISEVAMILNRFFDDTDWIDEVCEVIGELIDNIKSHTDGDCLIDIDICDVRKKHDLEMIRKAVTIVVMNFSERLLFEKVLDNIKTSQYDKKDKLYGQIYEAYDLHKGMFDDKYDEPDFAFVTAFQYGVTSRYLKSGNSGTGLATLIQRIIDKTEDDYSYALSGQNIIVFDRDVLNVPTESKLAGFNKENDYINKPPDSKAINRSDLFVTGSVYHLWLVKES